MTNGLHHGAQQDAENKRVAAFLRWIESPAANDMAGAAMIAEAKQRSADFTDRMKRLAANSLGLDSIADFDAMLNGQWITGEDA